MFPEARKAMPLPKPEGHVALDASKPLTPLKPFWTKLIVGAMMSYTNTETTDQELAESECQAHIKYQWPDFAQIIHTH